MSYSIGSYDHESVTLCISGVSAGDVIRVFCRYADDDSSSVHDSSFTVTQDSFDYLITGLESETSYVVNVGSKESSSSDTTDWWGGQTFTTSAKETVEEWSWHVSNGPEYCATADDTERAYDAITGQGLLTDFSHLVWNDIVYKTNEVITDRSGTWDTTYGTLSETLMISDKVMTAQRFNAVWWNLAQYVSTGFSTARVSGEEMLGEYFVTLATAVNKAIWRG